MGTLTPQDISFVQTFENPVMSEFIDGAAGSVLVLGMITVTVLLTYYRG